MPGQWVSAPLEVRLLAPACSVPPAQHLHGTFSKEKNEVINSSAQTSRSDINVSLKIICSGCFVSCDYSSLSYTVKTDNFGWRLIELGRFVNSGVCLGLNGLTSEV